MRKCYQNGKNTSLKSTNEQEFFSQIVNTGRSAKFNQFAAFRKNFPTLALGEARARWIKSGAALA